MKILPLADQEGAHRLNEAIRLAFEQHEPSPTLAVNTLLDTLASMSVYYELSLESLLQGVTLAYMAYATAEMPTADDTIN